MKKTIKALTLILFFIQSVFCQNNSLNFDGTDDYVNLGSSVCNGMRTIELWFNPSVAIDNSITNFISLVVRNDDGENDELQLIFDFIAPNEGKIRFARNTTSGYFPVFSNSNTWNANQWYHVAGVFNPINGIELYIDGVKQTDTDPHTGTPSSRPEIAALGRWGDANQRYFNGKIDDVRFWDVARTQAEIQNNMNTELAGTEVGLISYYKMDENNSSCDIKDCNSNENHGTRQGSGGFNNLPQFSIDIPSLTDITCGATTNCTTLPVELISFEGRLLNEKITLQWITATELNNSGFEIQKSKNGRDWGAIAFVEGVGTITDTNDYAYQDVNPFSGINYYRLKQIDFDGAFEYSKVIAVEYNSSERSISVFPNPSSGLINLQIDNPSNQKMKIKILDSVGRIVWESKLVEGERNWKEAIGIEGSGIYFVSAQIGDEVYYERVLITDEK